MLIREENQFAHIVFGVRKRNREREGLIFGSVGRVERAHGCIVVQLASQPGGEFAQGRGGGGGIGSHVWGGICLSF